MTGSVGRYPWGGDTAVVGAWLHTGGSGFWSGSAYVFDLVGVAGDLDRDCDVDVEDYANLRLCLGGPEIAPSATGPPGVDADLDDDGDVDFADFRLFQLALTHSR